MDENKEQGFSENPTPEPLPFPTGKKELIFALLSLIGAVALCNFTLFGGFNLGFALAVTFGIVCAGVYLTVSGCKPTFYSGSLLVLSVVIALGFARSDDYFVKFIMVCFLFVSINLGLCLTARQNLRDPGGFSTIWDAFGTFFARGFGKLPEAAQGLAGAFRRSGSAGQKGGAFFLGLALCVPVLAIVIPLLISADAAFSGLMGMLPEFDFFEFLPTVIFGIMMGCVVYTRGTAMVYASKKTLPEKAKRGMSAITVNTVFIAVAAVYLAYLASQLAYFVGGFAGILPEGYSTAEYARRGFFEMATLSGINLGLIALGLGLIKDEKAPTSTKVLCVFIGLVTLFLIAAASAKMFLYIGAYGLTPLRVLTQVVMLFLAVTTVVIMVWLFIPKLPYMKVVILAALLIGAVTFWADIDTVVANYNVDAYLSGKLETVDTWFLFNDIGPEAAGPMARLAQEADDPAVQRAAKEFLERYRHYAPEDFRDWNYVIYQAKYLPKQ